MNNDELLRKYMLVKNSNYDAIRAEALNFIVQISKSDISPERLQRMLILLNKIDSWVTDYEKELQKRKED